jgi:hypothetical protein
MICILITMFNFILIAFNGEGFLKDVEPLLWGCCLEIPFDLAICLVIGNLICYWIDRR